MKRRIAVFANAWSEKNLSDALEGIKTASEKANYDAFTFLSYAAPGMGEDEVREEKRIYKLPELDEFDGALLFTSTMNFRDLIDDICERAKKADIPIVSIGEKIEGLPFVGFNTKESMKELVQHLVSKHGVRTIEFIAGPKGNENSNNRLDATREVFAENGIVFDEGCIHYGSYGVREAMAITREIIAKYKDSKFPDAVLCVNDNVALAACKELEMAGIRVPEDVIVTGFDFIEDGRVYYPALCTVGQNDFEVGRIAAEALFSEISKQPVEDVVIKNRFIPNQSCGCENCESDKIRLEACKNQFFDKLATLEFGWSNSWVINALVKSPKLEEISENLNEYLGRSKIFGNVTSYILMDENAAFYLSSDEKRAHMDGYSDTFQVLTSVERNRRIYAKSISRRQMIPEYEKIDGVTKMYMFVPIHFQDWVFGYIVVEDWMLGISSRKLKIFLDYFNQGIDKLKLSISLEHSNDKLRTLYTTDSLTGLYNRFGFDSEGIKVFEHCIEQKKGMILMFTDINRMKLINDFYGHLHGDMAIKTVAEAIKKYVPDDWVAIRFGGDEFLIIGQCDDENVADEVQKNITAEVKQVGKEMDYPYYLSVSCGFMYFQPKPGDSLDTYVKKADEAMYKKKAFMHAQDMELRAFEDRCKNRL